MHASYCLSHGMGRREIEDSTDRKRRPASSGSFDSCLGILTPVPPSTGTHRRTSLCRRTAAHFSGCCAAGYGPARHGRIGSFGTVGRPASCHTAQAVPHDRPLRQNGRGVSEPPDTLLFHEASRSRKRTAHYDPAIGRLPCRTAGSASLLQGYSFLWAFRPSFRAIICSEKPSSW